MQFFFFNTKQIKTEGHINTITKDVQAEPKCKRLIVLLSLKRIKCNYHINIILFQEQISSSQH